MRGASPASTGAMRACTVRTASPADLAAVEDLRRRWIAETGGPWTAVHPAARAALAGGRGTLLRVLLAERRGGVAAGFASAWPALDLGDGPGLWLSDLYVLPDERRRGVATALVRAVAAAARLDGAAWVMWHADRGDAGAQAFYASLGATARPQHLAHALSGDALASL